MAAHLGTTTVENWLNDVEEDGGAQAIIDRFAHVQLRGEEDKEEDGGRSLAAYDQYCLEMLSIERPTPLEERRLADRSRAGDAGAGWELVQSCLPVIWSLASKYYEWTGRDIDVMDIVQAGNEAMVGYLEEALVSRNVCAALVVVAKDAMYRFAVENKSAMRVPGTSYHQGHRAPLTIRIINQEDVENSYQGILEEMLPSPTFAPTAVQRRDAKRARVLKALKHLAKYQRLAVMVWFRIDSPKTYRAITRDDPCCKLQFLNTRRFHCYKSHAIEKLRRVLNADEFYQAVGVQA